MDKKLRKYFLEKEKKMKMCERRTHFMDVHVALHNVKYKHCTKEQWQCLLSQKIYGDDDVAFQRRLERIRRKLKLP